MDKVLPASLLTYSEAAELLGLKISSLYSMTCRKRIPFLRLSGRAVRFDPVDLRKWLDARKNLTPHEATAMNVADADAAKGVKAAV